MKLTAPTLIGIALVAIAWLSYREQVRSRLAAQ